MGKELIGNAPVPMPIPPLSGVEARILWACLRHRKKMEELKAQCTFDVDIPVTFLTTPMQYKTFQKKGGKQYAMKLAGVVAWNHPRFVGGEEGFQKALASLGWKVSDSFVSR